MNGVLRWHTRIGDVGRRLAYLQALWLIHTLLGGIVLGIFPATAALVAVLRRDSLAVDGLVDPDARERLPREFHRLWRQEMLSANAVGWLLAALWAFVVVDQRLLVTAEVAAAPILSGLLWLMTAALACVSGTVWVLQAHFAEGPLAVMRRASVLLVARPLLSLGIGLIVAGCAALYYVVPGIGVVFGVAVPLGLAWALVWRSGVLPRPVHPSLVPPLTQAGVGVAV